MDVFGLRSKKEENWMILFFTVVESGGLKESFLEAKC